jgi:hypothetical protein
VVQAAVAASATDKTANFMKVEIFIAIISRGRRPVPGLRK